MCKRTQHVSSNNVGSVGQECCVRLHGALDQIIVLDQTQRRGVSGLFFHKISFKRVTQSAQPNNHALFITEIKKKSSLSELISIQQFCPVQYVIMFVYGRKRQVILNLKLRCN